MKGFLYKAQPKKETGNATEGKPITAVGPEANFRADISLPRTQRR